MRKLIIVFALAISRAGMSANPVATNVRALGEGLYNGGLATQLTGNYVFTDGDDDADVSTYQWYKSLASDGTGLSLIGGATGKRYTITSGDVGYYLYFEVTPTDDSPATGTPVIGSASSLVANTSYTNQTYGSTTTVNSGGTVDYLNATINNNKNLTVTNNTTLYIHGDLNTAKTTITVNAGSTLRISGQLIATNNLTIVNNGTLIIGSGLSAGNSAAISISGNVTIGGDLSLAPGGAGSLTVEGGGSLDVEGNFDVTDSDIEVNSPGTLNIDGNANTGSSPINGDGDVSIGGTCSGTNCGDGQITPIELGYFRVKSHTGYNEIIWTTLVEINNDYFTIYRSVNGIDFTAIAEVDGAGNHQGLLEYSYIDHAPLSGTSYYQLKQTDYDGEFEIFDAISVNQQKVEVAISAYPNPVIDLLSIQSESLIYQVNISDLSGRVLYSESSSGTTYIEVNTQAFKSGQYVVLIQTEKGLVSKHIIKN